MSDKKYSRQKSIYFFCFMAIIFFAMVTGCSTGTGEDGQTSATTPGLEESPSVPDETEKTPLQENLEESRAFQARLVLAVTDNEYEPDQSLISVEDLLEEGTSISGYFLLDKEKLFKIVEKNNTATDTLDGYYFISLMRTGEQERIYVPAGFDQYPMLYITYTTVSLYIPDGPVICLGEDTPGLVLRKIKAETGLGR